MRVCVSMYMLYIYMYACMHTCAFVCSRVGTLTYCFSGSYYVMPRGDNILNLKIVIGEYIILIVIIP